MTKLGKSSLGSDRGSWVDRLSEYPWRIFLPVGLIGLLVTAILVYSTVTGIRMASKYAMLADAAVEIQLRAAMAHVWIEEIVSGDTEEDVSVVHEHLDAAQAHARAMLDGGTCEGQTVTPLENPPLRKEIEGVLVKLQRFRGVAEERLERPFQAAAGSAIDQEFDAVFLDFLDRAQYVETELHGLMTRDLSRFRITQSLLVIFCWVLTFVVGIILYRDRVRMVKDRQAVEDSRRDREELIHRLRRQNEELEHFTHAVSHDLRTPLITVKGFLGLLEEDLAEGNRDAVAEDIFRSRRAANHMESLLGELLELSRVGRISNAPEETPLGELVSEVLEMAAVSLGAGEVRVEVADDLPVVYGDRKRLRDVLQNLVENAIKYMGEQPSPRITIDASEGDGKVVCRVGDNGIGIDPQFHDRVFSLFQQLDGKSPGTGMGLALVKRIVAIHGGRIWVESEGTGCGSCFCFELPCAADVSKGDCDRNGATGAS